MLKNKKILYSIISTVLIIGLAIGLSFGYEAYKNNQIEKGKKEITVNVIVDIEGRESYSKVYTIKTNAEYLGQALDEINLVGPGKYDPETARYIKIVDNIEVNEDNFEFWSLNSNGTFLNTGIDDTPIKDKDTFDIELTKWK